MIPYRFPFRWGSPQIDVTPPLVVVPPRWTNLEAVAQRWLGERANVLPRFQHLYPQESGGEAQFVRLSAVT